jgi:hypothetical protein
MLRVARSRKRRSIRGKDGRGRAVPFLGRGRGAARRECGVRALGVLRAASVGRTLSPSASVVVPLMSDFLAYFC